MNLRLSILVPVYNAAKWLPAFIHSMSRHEYVDKELLFLDDCSTDNSIKVLKREIAKNGLSSVVRILLHNENKGVSEARQTLLEAAKGEYIIFADPDDEVDSGMYDDLLKKAYSAEADFVWEDFFEGSSECRIQKLDGDASMLIRAILRGDIHGATWNKLIRRQFILDCGARFLSGRINICEDMDFICQILSANPKIAYNDACHYFYRTVYNSATHGLSEASFRSLKNVEDHLSVLLPKSQFDRELHCWRRGNRLAAFLSKNVSDEFFYAYLEDVRDLSGLSTNFIIKFLFKIATWGKRPFALSFCQLFQKIRNYL